MWKIFILVFLFACASMNTELTNQKIDDAIKSRNDLGSYQYEVIHAGSGIKLEGTAGSDYTKQEIEKIVEEVTGRKIQSTLIVKEQASDSGAAKQVRLAMKGLVLGEYNIKVNSIGQTIVLDGFCDNQVDEEKIIKAAYSVPGVSKVESKLTYRGINSDEELKNLVMIKLNALDGIDTSTIGVSVNNRVVSLTGSQKSRRDVDMILSNLQMVHGIREVKSQIKVGNKDYLTPEYIESANL